MCAAVQVIPARSSGLSVLHSLICLIGLHGSGKTTIARELVRDREMHRLSVGDLARLSRKSKLPSDIPVPLMLLLAQSKPGGVLSFAAAQLLTSHLQRLRQRQPVVIDGLPVSPEQIQLLDEHSHVVLVTVGEITRQQRLIGRSEHSKRVWTPGQPSLRDSLVLLTHEASRDSGINTITVSNDQTNPMGVVRRIRELCSV